MDQLSNWIGLGGGAGGFILALIVALGIRERITRVEQRQDTCVTEKTCSAVQSRVTAELSAIRSSQDKADDRADRMERMLDWLILRQNGGTRPPELS